MVLKPEDMRQAMADYVTAAHRAYVQQAQLLSPAVQGRLPLMSSDRFWVAAAGASNLHVVATREALGPARGPEVEVVGEEPPLRWTLRFYDPAVSPELGLVDETEAPAGDQVRSILGIRTYLYHLIVEPGSQLNDHHAGHTGAGLANAHAAEARDFDAIRAKAPGKERLVDEMEGASLAGLSHAQALLALELAPEDGTVQQLARQGEPDTAALRKAVLDALRSEP